MSRRFSIRFTRRKFAFWLGFGLFGLSEKLRAGGLDRLAAAIMDATDTATPRDGKQAPEHWTAAENRTWRWFERETLIHNRWTVTGITTPIHKRTGERATGRTGYLDDSLVPENVRLSESSMEDDPNLAALVNEPEDHAPGQPSAVRRARHGRPPSRWLRSLHADELRIWLKTVDVPEAGVSGMTFFEHLTRDHFFVAAHITGLAEDEQAKLHATAHYGY